MVLNVEIYNGHIRQTKELALTVASLEETLQRYKYSGEKRARNPAVENLILPPITLSFYSCIYKTGLLPSDSELVEEYSNQDKRSSRKSFSLDKTGTISHSRSLR